MKNCVIYLNTLDYIKDWSYFYAEAFRELGYTVNIINLLNEQKMINRNLEKFIGPDTAFFLSIYRMGNNFTIDGNSLYDKLKIPLLAVCIDHPDYNFMEMQNKSRFTFWGLYDSFDYNYAVKYLNPANNYFFAPNAGFPSSSPAIPFNEREYDIMFCGSVQNYEQLRDSWRGYNNPHIAALCEAAVEILLCDEQKTIYEAFEEAMLYSGYISLNKAGNNFHGFINNISLYVRGYRRAKLLKELSETGLTIHCFGYVEQLDKFSSHNLMIHNYLKTHEYLHVLSRSKIVLNTTPMAKYAATERMLSAMINGAAVATDINLFTKEHFTENTDFIGFSHQDYKALGDRLAELLTKPNILEEIAANGEEKVRELHTVRHRAENIVAVAEIGKYLLL